jgi:hypothetical protein
LDLVAFEESQEPRLLLRFNAFCNTLRFKDRASEMMVETIEALSASSTILTMKERSIFSAFTGSLEAGRARAGHRPSP